MMDHFYTDDSLFSSKNWFTAESLIRRAVIGAASPAVFVELGTHRGRSLAYTAVEIARTGKNIDLFGYEIHAELARSAAKNLKRFANVQVVRKDSTEAAATFDDQSVDFIFMDSAKTYEKLCADIDAWLPKMRIGSVMAGDDYWWTDRSEPLLDSNADRFGMWQLRPSFPIARAVHERFPEYELIVTRNWAKWWVVLA